MVVVAMAPPIGVMWWKRRARRMYAIDHVEVEMHPPCVVEDRVDEQARRAAISLANASRRPRLLSLLGVRNGLVTGSV